MKLLATKTPQFFTVDEARQRAQREMQRTGLSAEELLRQQADADSSDWRTVPATGIMEYWLRNRPAVRNTEPTVASAQIQAMLTTRYSLTDIAGALLFKGISNAEMDDGKGGDTEVSRLLRDRLHSPPGYYSTDVCRALSFVNGRRKPVQVGDVGWLMVCATPWGEKPILDNATFGDGRPVHNNDFVYAGANVLALARVQITALSR